MKEKYITALKTATRRFLAGGEIGLNRYEVCNEMNQLEDTLNERFGLDWDEIEAIEENCYC